MSNMSDISPQENRLADIVLKVKKITEALYRITDFFPDEEPLKWILRKDAVEILNSVFAAKSVSNYERIRHTNNMSMAVGRILNLIELASFGSFIAKSNFEVLRREYRSVLTYIMETDFNEVDLLLKNEATTAEPENLISSPFFNLDSYKSELILKNDEKTTIIRNGLANPVDEIKKDNDNNLQFNERHAKIISLVTDKKGVSISDICPYFNGVSEKTIQRDLIFLVNRGLLDMSGDRRWRRYVLKMRASSSSNI